MERDIERRVAIAALLAHPDPPELRRGHRLRLNGKPERYELVAILTAAFVQRKLLELHDRRTEYDSTAVLATRVVATVAEASRSILAAA